MIRRRRGRLRQEAPPKLINTVCATCGHASEEPCCIYCVKVAEFARFMTEHQIGGAPTMVPWQLIVLSRWLRHVDQP